MNEEDQATFLRTNSENISIIDLAFATPAIKSNIVNWYIDKEIATGSDHEVIRFSILTDNSEVFNNPILRDAFNLKKADWEKFNNLIIKGSLLKESCFVQLNTIQELENASNHLQNIILKAADESIPKNRDSAFSKPWWNEDINRKRQILSQKRRIWKKNQNLETHEAYKNARNIYFCIIKEAKQGLWNSFLESAQGKDIFKAFNYTKYRKVEKLPIIKYKSADEIEQIAISFEGKSKAFLNILLPEPPISEAPDWSNYQAKDEWEWPEIAEIEIQKAVLGTSTKTAPGPDKISYAIIQQAFKAIPHLFYKLYPKLIERGYHPNCWKEAIGIILKKPNKADYSKPKAYRIISLLNCLGKLSEKLIANRLGFLAETTDLLNSTQIGGRLQKSAIDAAMALTHDIQIGKNKKQITSCLFMDIKGAFDHVSINQLLRVCQKL